MPTSLRKPQAVKVDKRLIGERRVNKMFDRAAESERRLNQRRAQMAKAPQMAVRNGAKKTLAQRAVGAIGNIAKPALKRLGPVGIGAGVLLEGINAAQRRIAQNIEQGGDINNPTVIANRKRLRQEAAMKRGN